MDSLDIWIEFLEIIIHNILYHRKLYPEKIFTLKKKYNVPIHIITHPKLNSYIGNVLNAVKYLSKKGQLDQLYLHIADEQGNPLQNYVFNLIHLENLSQIIKSSNDPFLIKLESMMRSICLKIALTNVEMHNLPDNAQFELLLNLKEYYLPTDTNEEHSFQEFPWTGAEERNIKIKNAKIVPFKNFDFDYFQLEMYVEQAGVT